MHARSRRWVEGQGLPRPFRTLGGYVPGTKPQGWEPSMLAAVFGVSQPWDVQCANGVRMRLRMRMPHALPSPVTRRGEERRGEERYGFDGFCMTAHQHGCTCRPTHVDQHMCYTMAATAFDEVNMVPSQCHVHGRVKRVP